MTLVKLAVSIWDEKTAVERTFYIMPDNSTAACDVEPVLRAFGRLFTTRAHLARLFSTAV